MGNIVRMGPKLPSKCRDVSWPSPPTPNSNLFFQNVCDISILVRIYNIHDIIVIIVIIYNKQI